MNRWIIEARDENGQLKFDCRQPEEVFGPGAIHGMTDDQMAKVIFKAKPDAVMHGTDIPNWCKQIDENWIARKKTW